MGSYARLLFPALAVVLSASPTIAQPTITFGPKQYVRATGLQQTFTERLPRCAGDSCQLVVVNGNPDGSNRVSSASISVSGARILGPSDFNPHVDRIVRPVSLSGNAQLEIVLRSKPGSFLTVSLECSSIVALTIADPPGVISSILDNGTVSLSIPLQNLGSVAVTGINIANIEAPPGTYAGPTPFPYLAGDIDPGETQQLFAQFTGLDGHAAFPLTIVGSYGFGDAVCSFQAQSTVNPPPAGNGGQPKAQTTAPTFTIANAIFRPAQPHPADDEPNTEDRYFPPIGELRNLFPAPPSPSVLDRVLAFHPNDQMPPSGGSPSAVVFLRNNNGGSYQQGIPPDPSVAGSTPSGFAMISANDAVSYSTDFGNLFTTVNLTKANGFTDPGNPARTDFFPEDDGGLCCDQVLHYVPSHNLMVWLTQYWSPNINVGGLPQRGQNRIRIAYATPQAATADFLHAWRWFDISPATLGDTTATDWFDYPDLAFSNDWLYISVDHGVWNANKDAAGNVIGQQVKGDRRWIVRASLNDMANSAANINIKYYEPVKNGLIKAHFAQSSPDAMYYAANSDTSTLSVFADPDSAPNIPTPKDIKVSSYCSSSGCDYSVNAPDNLDWNVAPHGVIGATFAVPSFLCPPEGCSPIRYVYFALDGGRDNGNGRPFPYVRVAKVDAVALNLVSELDIWNPGFAYATAALTWRPPTGAQLPKDEVAFSLAAGGGGAYADNAVGFLGDFVAYVTTSSNATQSDTSAPPTVRYGDYFGVRNATGPATAVAGQGRGYSTLGYAITQTISGSTCAVGGCNVALQYVLFGRSAELFPVTSPPPH